MGEPIWCNIDIKIPAAWAPEGEALNDWKLPAELDCQLASYLETDIERLPDGNVLIHQAGEGNYGLCDSSVEAVLDFCEKHHIPYDARDDPKYEFDGSTRTYLGGDEVIGFTSNADGAPTMTKQEYEQILAGKSWAKTVGEFFEPPDIRSVDVSHLPARAPWETDEEDDDAGRTA